MKLNNQLLLFLFLVTISGLITFFLQEFVISESLWFDYFESKNLESDEINSVLDFYEEWSLINYITLPLIYLLKISLIAFWILSGAILYGYRISFIVLLEKIILAEFVWLILPLISIFWFGFFASPDSVRQIENFGFISVLDLVNGINYDGWIVYLLRSISLIHIIYILILSLELKKVISTSQTEALKFTTSVYGSAFFVWIVFYSFVSLNLY